VKLPESVASPLRAFPVAVDAVTPVNGLTHEEGERQGKLTADAAVVILVAYPSADLRIQQAVSFSGTTGAGFTSLEMLRTWGQLAVDLRGSVDLPQPLLGLVNLVCTALDGPLNKDMAEAVIKASR